MYMKIYRGTYPRSSELYHYGILGQKWGVRRFQNPDGSLTAEGRERYGSGNGESAGQKIKAGARHVGSAVVKGAKAVGKYAVKKFKQRHTSLMTKEELDEYVKRLAAEKSVVDMQKYIKSSRAIPAAKLVSDILSEGAKTIGRGAFNKLNEEMYKTPEQRRLEELKTRADLFSEQNRVTNEARAAEVSRLYNIMLRTKPGSKVYKAAEDRLVEINDEYKKFIGTGGAYASGGGPGGRARVTGAGYTYLPRPGYGSKGK